MTYDPNRHHRRSIRLRDYDYTMAGAYFVTIVCQDRACLFGDVVDGIMRPNDAGRMVQAVWDEIPLYYPGVDVDAAVIMPNHMHGILVLFDDIPDHLAQSQPGQPEPRQPIPGQPRGVAPTNGDDPVGSGPRARPDSDARPDPHARSDSRTGADSNARAEMRALTDDPVDDEQNGQPSPRQPRGGAPTRRMALSDLVHRYKTLTTKRYTDGVKQSGWTPYNGRVWQRNYYEHIVRNDHSLQRIRDYIDANPMVWTTDPENPDAPGRTGA